MSGITDLWNGLSRHHPRLELWRSTLAQHGMVEVERSGFATRQAQLTARAGTIEVRITEEGKKKIVVAVAGPQGFSVLKLRRKSLEPQAREIEIGDEAFDNAFLLEGPLRSACLLLDVATRRLLARASAACGSLEIGDGQIRVEIAEKVLPDVLPLLFEIGRRLTEPADAERRIVRNARRDPKPRVRLANLLVLAREYPGDPDTLKALRSACRDTSPAVRLRAAIELGAEGRDIVLRLAESAKDDALRAQAVAHLGSQIPLERATKILSRSRQKGHLQTARATLEALGRRGAAAVDVLAQVLAQEKGELAAAAALALGETGAAAAEPPLLQALQTEDDGLREAVVTILGRVGTAAAVQPLQEAAESSWLDRDLRQAMRQAIAEIQSRLEGASPGQLSLADAEAGQLSLAQSEAGQLSLSGEEEG